MQRAFLHQHGRHRATAAIQPAFNHCAFGRAVRIGAQLQHFRLQQNGFFELVQAGLLQRRDFHILGLAAHLFQHDLVLQQFLAHPVRVRAGPVDLVDRHDHRHVRRLGVFDRLDRLRHHAVIGGHHQHDDIRHLGAARPHGGEGLVARRVEEGDLRARRQLHLIGADMLGDATRLAGRHISMAQRVQQAGLAMVDMAHDRHHRRPRLEIGHGIARTFQAKLDIGIGDAAGAMAEFGNHQLGGVGVDRLGDGRHHAQLHQRFHHVGAARRHTVGELLHGDGFRQDHFAHHFQTIRAQQLQLGLTALALTLAAHRGERTHFLVLAFDRGLHIDAAGTAAVADLLGRRHRGAALGCRANARTAHAARRLFLFFRAHAGAGRLELQGFACGAGGSRLGARRLRPGAGGATRSGRGGTLRLDPLGRISLLGRGLFRGGGGFGGHSSFGSGDLGSGSGGGLFDGPLHSGFFLTAARFFGRGKDGNLFLLAAFGLALRGQALFGQHALARRDFRGGQSAATSGRTLPGRGIILLRLRRGALGRLQRRGRLGCGRRRRRRGGRPSWAEAPLLAHLDLHHFRAPMREALPHGSGIDGMTRIAARGRAQGKPAFGFSLVVAVTHAKSGPSTRLAGGDPAALGVTARSGPRPQHLRAAKPLFVSFPPAVPPRSRHARHGPGRKPVPAGRR